MDFKEYLTEAAGQKKDNFTLLMKFVEYIQENGIKTEAITDATVQDYLDECCGKK
jgi:hypothetical protein